MNNIAKLPTAATSYFTVHKAGPYFDVVLVTPCPGKNLKTKLYRFADRGEALECGAEIAARQHRPFKAKG